MSLADNAVVVGVLKASVADIKQGSYIGSGAMPQPDGTQKAVEVHIFADRSVALAMVIGAIGMARPTAPPASAP